MEETYDQFQARLRGAAISTYILVMLIVPLKVWCRWSIGRVQNVGADDYICLFALVCANAFFYVCMCGMGPSLARHAITELPLNDVIDFLKFLFAGQLLYVISLAMVKLTILAFYWRLFSISSRLPICIALFIVIAWALSVIFVVIFTCDPIEAQWDVTITDKRCISLGTVYISGSTPNVVTDLLILLMPMPYVWRLHAPLAQKVMLGGMFMLACFVSIVSIVRLTILVGIPLASSDVTYNTKEVIVWSIVEINIGLICACLPSMKQALYLLHLDKLFIGSAGQQDNKPDLGLYPTTIRKRTDCSRGPNRGGRPGGMFSSLVGLTRLDDEEDDLRMIDKATALHNGNMPTNEINEAHAVDTDMESRGETRNPQDGATTV